MHKIKGVMGVALVSMMVGCGGNGNDSQPKVIFRADLVPLKVAMTDYVIDWDGEKLFKIEGSAQLIVPLADHKPTLKGRTVEYLGLPQPRVDNLSCRIDSQKPILNVRGWFTSQKADSKRINELRKEAAVEMQKVAGNEKHIQIAKKNAEEVLCAFYKKLGHEGCSIKWEK